MILQPNTSRHAVVHADNARQHTLLGEPHEAIMQWRQALALSPNEGQWWLELARLQREHEPSHAYDSYRQAMALGNPHANLEALPLATGAHIKQLSPRSVWNPQRLDIAVKLLYARQVLGKGDAAFASQVATLYRQHILYRTGGVEPGSAIKHNVDDYEQGFRQLIAHMAAHGFASHAAIPLAATGQLLNGAHRLAAAIALDIPQIPCFMVPDTTGYDWGMRWFLQHDFTPADLNLILQGWRHGQGKQASALILWPDSHSDLPALMRQAYAHGRLVAWRDIALTGEIATLLPNSPATQHASLRVLWLQMDAAGCNQLASMLQPQVDVTPICNREAFDSLAAVLLDESKLESLLPSTTCTAHGLDAWLGRSVITAAAQGTCA